MHFFYEDLQFFKKVVDPIAVQRIFQLQYSLTDDLLMPYGFKTEALESYELLNKSDSYCLKEILSLNQFSRK